MLTTSEVMDRLTNLQQLALENKASAQDLLELSRLEEQLFQSFQQIRSGRDLPTTEDLVEELYDPDRLKELLKLAESDHTVAGALKRASASRIKQQRLHAFPRRAYAWRLNEEGEEEMYKLTYRSQPAACWAALRSMLSGELRALYLRTRQYVLDLPNRPITPELAAEHGLPSDPSRLMAASQLLLEKWMRDYEGHEGRREAFKLIPSWEELQSGPLTHERLLQALKSTQLWEMQRAYAILRLECTIEEGGLTAVDAKPYTMARHATEEFREDGRLRKVYVTRVPEISSSVVTAVDRRLIGPEGIIKDVSRIPYSMLSFSSAGIDPKTGAADFRVVWGIPVDARTINAVSVILGHGEWKQDGASYVIGSDADHPAWSTEFQFRAGKKIATTKGVLLPLYPEYIEERLRLVERAIRIYERKAAAEPESSPDGAQYVLEAMYLKRMLKEGRPALERMLARYRQLRATPKANRKAQGVALFVEGDQIKVPLTDPDGRAEGEGPWLMAGTFLRGKLYNMAFNSQGIQLLQNSAARALRRFMEQVVREDLYWPLLTPEGIAGVVDERIGNAVAAASGDTITQVEEIDLDNLDTLRLACLSNVIRHTSRGRELRLKGAPMEPGQVQIPGLSILRLLDAVWAGQVSSTLRSWGLTLQAGLLLTCEDSVSTWQQLAHGNCGIARGSALEALCAEHAGKQISVREYRALPQEEQRRWTLVYGRRREDAPKFYLPHSIVKLINGDNDGDLVAGIASDVALADGRVVKLVLIMRYPVVDAPVLWVLPAGTKTPWDAPYQEIVHAGMTREELLRVAHSLFGRFPQLSALNLRSRRAFPEARLVQLINDTVNKQARRYREFLEIFDARVPDGADLFGDEPVLAESKLVRIMDVGIKTTLVKKKKATGPATHRAALDMCYRKAERNQTGPYTRGHERLAVRMLYALAMHEKSAREGKDIMARMWYNEFREWARRMKESGVCIEDQVTGFKHILASDPRFPSLYLYDEKTGRARDRVFNDVKEAKDVITLDYHTRINNLKYILDRFRPKDSEEEALETMDYFGAAPGSKYYGTIGKESMVLNKLLDTELSAVVEAFSAIKTDLAPYVKELDERTKAFKLTPQMEEERYQAVAQLDSWSSFWTGDHGSGGVMEHYYEILSDGGAAETDEAFKRAEDFRKRAARAKKDALKAFGETISMEALTLAVADHWSEDGQERHSSSGASYVKRVNASPAIAMMGRRITEVFPRPNLEVTLEKARQNQLVVFTTQAELDMQGLDLHYTGGEKIECDRIAYSPEKQLFLMLLGDKIVPWHLADRQRFDPEALSQSNPKGWHLVAIGGKRAMLYYE